VTALDERTRELLTDWLAAFESPSYMSAAEYRSQLVLNQPAYQNANRTPTWPVRGTAPGRSAT